MNRKIILYESVINNDHQFYGLGVNTSALRYQVDATTSNHVFYAGASSVASTELMRLTGGGNLQLGTSAIATARLVVSGGVQNTVIFKCLISCYVPELGRLLKVGVKILSVSIVNSVLAV